MEVEADAWWTFYFILRYDLSLSSLIYGNKIFGSRFNYCQYKSMDKNYLSKLWIAEHENY